MGYQITYEPEKNPEKPYAWQAFMSSHGLIMGNAESFAAASCELYIGMNELLEEPCPDAEVAFIREDYEYYAQHFPYPGSPEWRPMTPYDGPGFGDDVHELENIARRIFSTAIRENCAGETLERLFAGDAVTIDEQTGALCWVTAEQLQSMAAYMDEDS